MKILITEKQKDKLMNHLIQELRDASQYAAKSQYVMSIMDKLFDYLPVQDPKSLYDNIEWYVYTLKNGIPYARIYEKTMFYKLQSDPRLQNLCGSSDQRDEMLKNIIKDWMKKKKEQKN